MDLPNFDLTLDGNTKQRVHNKFYLFLLDKNNLISTRERMLKPWIKLSRNAKDESWGDNYFVLSTYIVHTLENICLSGARRKDLIPMFKSKDKNGVQFTNAIFNTGLMDASLSFVYGVFFWDETYSNWRLLNWHKQWYVEQKGYPMPDPYQYITDTMHLSISLMQPINADFEVIFSRHGRKLLETFFQRYEDHEARFQDLTEQLLRKAITRTRARCANNYRTAVPHFIKGKVELLVPLYLSKDSYGKPDLVLSLKRSVKDDGTSCYDASTIVTMRAAYCSARLIAPVESDWLLIDYVRNEFGDEQSGGRDDDE
jgi:hypothetical protein